MATTVLVLDAIPGSTGATTTLLGVRDELATLMDTSDTSRYTQARVNAAINWALRDSWHDLAEIVSQEFTTTLDDRDYNLPTDFIGLKNLWIQGLTSALYTRFWPFESAYADEKNPLPLGPSDYNLINDAGVWKIRFKSASVPGGLTMRMEYYRRWGTLASDSDTTGCPLAYIVPQAMAHLYESWELMNPRYDVEDIRTRIALLKDNAEAAKREYRVSLAPTISLIRARIGHKIGE